MARDGVGTGSSRSTSRTDLTDDDNNDYNFERSVRQGELTHVPNKFPVFESPHPQVQILTSILTTTLHGMKF